MNNFYDELAADWSYVWKVILLFFIGMVCIYSSTIDVISSFFTANIFKQGVWFLSGMGLFVTISMIPSRVWYRMTIPLYVITIGLLVLVLFIGKGKAHRWIQYGFIQFQPSEFAKVTTLLISAKYLSKDKEHHSHPHQIMGLMGLVGIPCLLVLKEPDIGTASVFLALFWGMVIWMGISFKMAFCLFSPFLALFSGFHPVLFVGFMIILICVFILLRIKWFYCLGLGVMNLGLGFFTPVFWEKLEVYQRQRILSFLGLLSDPQGSAYQVIQSKVAIGSGGFFGKGFLQGSQTHLRFLPEQHTDFIFSVLGEEFGFIGCFLVLGLLFWLLRQGLITAKKAKNQFESFVGIGSVTVIAYQCIVNIGMTLGFFPVTGLPLPFLSYGGSSLWMGLILIGFLSNISARRYEY